MPFFYQHLDAGFSIISRTTCLYDVCSVYIICYVIYLYFYVCMLHAYLYDRCIYQCVYICIYIYMCILYLMNQFSEWVALQPTFGGCIGAVQLFLVVFKSVHQ